MEITSITPIMRVTKEDNSSVCDMYVSSGDNICITDIEGKIFTGAFLFMKLSENAAESGLIVLNTGNKNAEFPCSQVKSIENYRNPLPTS